MRELQGNDFIHFPPYSIFVIIPNPVKGFLIFIQISQTKHCISQRFKRRLSEARRTGGRAPFVRLKLSGLILAAPQTLQNIRISVSILSQHKYQ